MANSDTKIVSCRDCGTALTQAVIYCSSCGLKNDFEQNPLTTNDLEEIAKNKVVEDSITHFYGGVIGGTFHFLSIAMMFLIFGAIALIANEFGGRYVLFYLLSTALVAYLGLGLMNYQKYSRWVFAATLLGLILATIVNIFSSPIFIVFLLIEFLLFGPLFLHEPLIQKFNEDEEVGIEFFEM